MYLQGRHTKMSYLFPAKSLFLEPDLPRSGFPLEDIKPQRCPYLLLSGCQVANM
jgi:hypothetical protein